jgi:anionic cell wall polymer biosynthesis LytR-Cps2A-Psr (LCP) family protein
LRGDIGRLDAQKLFMAAFFKKCRYSLTLSDVEGLISVMLPNVKTDLGFFQLLSLASDAMSIDGSSLCFVTAPGEDIVSSVSGAWYYVLSAEGMRRLTSELLGSEDSFDENGLFLNEKNDDAVRIYRKNIEYKTFIADDINQNGVKID